MRLNRSTILKRFSLIAFLTACVTCAHATSITYDLTNVATDVGSLTGTVNIDASTFLVTAANVMFNNAAVGDPVFNTISSVNLNQGIGQAIITGGSNGTLNNGGQLALYYSTANIAVDGDLAVCTALNPCANAHNQGSFEITYAGNAGGKYNVTGGTLSFDGTVPDSLPTPEPSTLVLMGTAILLMAALMARMSGRGSAGLLARNAAE